MQQLTYPFDPIDKQNLKRFINDEVLGPGVFDAFWKNVYYYSSQYESLDGVSLAGNVPTVNDTGITMATAAVLNSTSELVKGAVAQMVTTFDKQQGFRITTDFYVGSLTAMTAHFVVGTYSAGPVATDYYGFAITNGVLSGITANSTNAASSTVVLETLTVNTFYELGARLDPAAKRVTFFVNGTEKGNLTTNIPQPASSTILPVGMGNLYDWHIKTTNADAKTVSIGNFELLQQRYINN